MLCAWVTRKDCGLIDAFRGLADAFDARRSEPRHEQATLRDSSHQYNANNITPERINHSNTAYASPTIRADVVIEASMTPMEATASTVQRRHGACCTSSSSTKTVTLADKFGDDLSASIF